MARLVAYSLSSGISFMAGPDKLQEHSHCYNLHRSRCCRVLEEGMVVTVEPGCYFNPFLLHPAFEDPSQGPFLNKRRLEASLVRILSWPVCAVFCCSHPVHRQSLLLCILWMFPYPASHMRVVLFTLCNMLVRLDGPSHPLWAKVELS